MSSIYNNHDIQSYFQSTLQLLTCYLADPLEDAHGSPSTLDPELTPIPERERRRYQTVSDGEAFRGKTSVTVPTTRDGTTDGKHRS